MPKCWYGGGESTNFYFVLFCYWYFLIFLKQTCLGFVIKALFLIKTNIGFNVLSQKKIIKQDRKPAEIVKAANKTCTCSLLPTRRVRETRGDHSRWKKGRKWLRYREGMRKKGFSQAQTKQSLRGSVESECWQAGGRAWEREEAAWAGVGVTEKGAIVTQWRCESRRGWPRHQTLCYFCLLFLQSGRWTGMVNSKMVKFLRTTLTLKLIS